jgi:peptidoglycan/xylan/chitin deacetylase (PgdA/CDA1 family)
MRRLLLVLAALSLPLSAAGTEKPAPKRVALVFDDGPSPENAERLLAILEREKVRVSFAYVARNVEAHPALAKKAQAAGHEIVNHSYAHLHPNALSDEGIAQEIVGGQKALAAIVSPAPRWYWAPFGEQDARMPALFEKAGIRPYLPRGFVSSDDWNREVPASEIRRRATTGVGDDTVILFHEWRNETIEELPAILAELKRQGCTFLSFSDLFAIGGGAPRP